MTIPPENLLAKFAETFGEGGNLHRARAPGRVNLIGEHTDYTGGLVLPIAIQRDIWVAFRSRDDSTVRVQSSAFPGETDEFTLRSPIDRGGTTWARYVRGVANGLLARGIPLPGMDAYLLNTLPVGAGLSSSAAIMVSFATAILYLAGEKLDPVQLALLCQQAEHQYAGVPSGIMDQTIVASARANHALLLDTRSMERQYIPINPAELRFALFDTGIRHSNAGNAYRDRRAECELALKQAQRARPGLSSLRDLSPADLPELMSSMEPVPASRCRHVVTENARTIQVARLLEECRYEPAGQLMNEGHQSLKDDFEVTIEELDLLQALCREHPQVYGARMTGAGFGGCVVALCRPAAEEEGLLEHVGSGYERRFGRRPEAWFTDAAGAASVWTG